MIAYFVPREGRPIPLSDLRKFLKSQLPDYTIPSRFVALTQLPLTPNGKIDRQALPDPGSSRPELANSCISPRSSVERKLAEIWAEVLSIEQVGVHDNFFDLGGRSLAASKIITRVIQTFQLELSIKALFDSPTVTEMAKVILENRAKGADPIAVERILSEIEALSEDEAKGLLKPEIKEEL